MDAANADLSFSPGNLIRGVAKGRWFTSSVSAAGPVGTAKVQLRLWVTANQFGGVLSDNARWSSPNV